MKSKILAATCFAAILLIASCDLFKTKKTSQNNLVSGKYQLINATDTPTTASRKPDDTMQSLFKPVNSSNETFVTFEDDSVLFYSSKDETVTTKYYADTASQLVFIKQDGAFNMYHFIPESDSIINLANDSIFFALKKL